MRKRNNRLLILVFILLSLGLYCKKEELAFNKIIKYLVEKNYSILLNKRHSTSALDKNSLKLVSARLDSLLDDPNLTVGPLPDRIVSGVDEDTGLFDVTYLIRINDPEGTYYTHYLVVIMKKDEEGVRLYDIKLSGGTYY